MHPWFNSLLQLVYRLAYRLAEVIQSPSIHPPVKGFAYIGAGYPKLDVVDFIGHRFLIACEFGMRSVTGKEEKTYLDHCQENTGGAKNGLGWGCTRGLLGEIQGFDSHIQQSEGILLTFLSFGTLRIHGRRWWYLREKGCGAQAVQNPNIGGQPFGSRLVQTEPFDERHCIRGRGLEQMSAIDRSPVPSFCNQHSLSPPCRPGEIPNQVTIVFGSPMFSNFSHWVHRKLKRSLVTYPPPVAHLQHLVCCFRHCESPTITQTLVIRT